MDSILIISDFEDVQYRKDSGTPAFRLIVEALAKNYHVHIIAPEGDGVDGNNIFYHRFHIGRIPLPGRIGNIINAKIFWFLFVLKARQLAREVVEKHNPILVYGAGCCSTQVAAKVGREFCIPSVGRLFGTYLYPYINNPIQLILRFDEALAFTSDCSAFVITNDGTVGDKVARILGVPKEKIFFWRNGVDQPAEAKGRLSSDIRIISMARLERWKRVDRIINAFEVSAREHKDLMLDIVGDGPEKESLRDLVRAYGLEFRVRFYGEVDRKIAARLLARSDVFITTNDYSNLSNSLMEAMYAGKTVIALNTGNTSDLVRDGNGMLIINEDFLSNAINAAIEEETRKYYGANAKDFATKNFDTWDKRIDREVLIVKRLIGEVK